MSDEASLPWLRTQAHTKDEEGIQFLVFTIKLYFIWNYILSKGSVFDSIIELLKRMQEDLLRRLVEAVMLEVKAKSQPYRLDK